ncbi:MAG: lysophospholipid acyltransferase family protein [Candidatus Binatia bacterium]
MSLRPPRPGPGKPAAPPLTSSLAPKRLAAGARRLVRNGLLRILVAVSPFLLSSTLRLLARTIRIRYVNATDLFDRWAQGQRVIIACWHSRVVLMPVARQGQKFCIMNSASRDGEIATRALARWGIRSVRGSATRGGTRGFLQLVDAYRQGYSLAVVPDGPHGPRGVVKPGVIHLARITGAPIFPVTYAARHQRQLRTWDRLLIPLPGSRVVYVVGEPLVVPRHTGDDEVERLRRLLAARLDAITQAAESQVAG